MSHPIDEYSYHLGAADAFCEMVRSGLKKVALSHPCDTKERRDSFLKDFDRLSEKYGVRYYVEDATIITDLFPASANKGKFQVLFYKKEEDLQEYLNLKKMKENAITSGNYDEVREEIALRWGKLLSYPEEGSKQLILNNQDKEE